MAPPRLLALLASILLLNALVPLGLAAEDDEAILNSEIGRQNNQSLLWGPYRPNLYFGVRPRLPKSIMTGLMWGKVDNYQEVQNSTLNGPPPPGRGGGGGVGGGG
jgi:mannosyl-oligosaccharide glucosidase